MKQWVQDSCNHWKEGANPSLIVCMGNHRRKRKLSRLRPPVMARCEAGIVRKDGVSQAWIAKAKAEVVHLVRERWCRRITKLLPRFQRCDVQSRLNCWKLTWMNCSKERGSYGAGRMYRCVLYKKQTINDEFSHRKNNAYNWATNSLGIKST